MLRTFVGSLFLVAACTPRDDKPPAPDFGIVAPAAGDTLVEGSTYVIRWHAGNVATVNLGAAMGGKDKGQLLTGAPATPDSLVWTVPVGFVTGFGPASSDAVRLRLEDAADPTHFVEAGPFTVVGHAQP